MSNSLLDEQAFRDLAAKDGVTHISTGVAIIRGSKILVARRAAHDFLGGVYELPGGGIEEGETITAGAIREVKEETGLTVSQVLGTFTGFDYSTDRKPHVRQVNFLVTVKPGDVVLDPNEHDTFQWIGAEDTPSVNMTENMRQCLTDAFTALKA